MFFYSKRKIEIIQGIILFLMAVLGKPGRRTGLYSQNFLQGWAALGHTHTILGFPLSLVCKNTHESTQYNMNQQAREEGQGATCPEAELAQPPRGLLHPASLLLHRTEGH